MTDKSLAKFIDDLRTPLTSVWSLSEILNDYPNLNGEKRREFLDIIIQETRRMAGIIKGAESPVRSSPDTFTQVQTNTVKI